MSAEHEDLHVILRTHVFDKWRMIGYACGSSTENARRDKSVSGVIIRLPGVTLPKTEVNCS